MADEYKALTVVHLPFARQNGGKVFTPGEKITREDFEKNYEGTQTAYEKTPDAEHLTADEQIAYLMEWGSISDDMEADLHPDHRPVDPGQPTILQLIEQARTLVPQLQERGVEVPSELQKLASLDYQHVVAGDAGNGVDAQ